MTTPHTNSSPSPDLGNLINNLLEGCQVRLIGARGQSSPTVIVGEPVGKGKGNVAVVWRLELDASVASLFGGAAGSYVLKLPLYVDNQKGYRDNCESIRHELKCITKLNNVDKLQFVPRALTVNRIMLIANDKEYDLDSALIISLAPGKPLDEEKAPLDERTSIEVGCQLAQVVAMAHDRNLQCIDMKLDRLFWHTDSKKLTVIDWNVTGDMLDFNETEKQKAKRADARRVAELIAEMRLGRVLGTDERASKNNEFSLSLGTLIDEVISYTTKLGEDPAYELAERLEAIVKDWRRDPNQLYSDLSSEIDQLRSNTKDSNSIIEIDQLYGRIDIGRHMGTQENWDTLSQSLDQLWEGQLRYFYEEIKNGNFSAKTADKMLRIRFYPKHAHLKILWRRRLLSLRFGDSSMDKGRGLAMLLDLLDKEDYSNRPTLLNIVQEGGSETYQLLEAEIKIAERKKAFDGSTDLARRLQSIDNLNAMKIPTDMDPQLLQWRSEMINEYQTLRDQQAREQARNSFASTLNQLRGRLVKGETLTDTEFDAIVKLAQPQERARVHRLKALAEALRTHDTASALRLYSRLDSTLDDSDKKIEARIVALIYAEFASLKSMNTYQEAFDHLVDVDRPVRTPEVLAKTNRLLEALLPLVPSDERQQKLAQLQDKEREISIAILALPDKTSVLKTLRTHEMTLSDDQMTIDLFEPGIPYQQVVMIRKNLEEVLKQFPETPPTLANLDQQVTAIDERGLGTDQGRTDHQQLWESVNIYAKPLMRLTYQHRIIEATDKKNQLEKMFAVLTNSGDWNSEQQGQALELANQLSQLRRIILVDSPKVDQSAADNQHALAAAATTINQIDTFARESQEVLEKIIHHELSFDSKLDFNEQANFLLKARRMLQIFDALDDAPKDRPSEGLDKLAPQLRVGAPEERRKLLGLLPPDTAAESLADALRHASQRDPRRSSLRLILAGLIVLVALVVGGFGASKWLNQPTNQPSPTPTVTTQAEATTPALPTAPPPSNAPMLRLAWPVPDHIEITQGAKTELVIPVIDANSLASTALLKVTPPDGITIDGSRETAIAEGRGVFPLTIVVAANTPVGEHHISFNLKDSAEKPIDIVVKISGGASIGDLAQKLNTQLKQLLTIKVIKDGSKEASLRSKPNQDSAVVESLTVDSQLRILQLPAEGGYLRVQLLKNPEKVGWVTIDPAFTSYQANAIKIDGYPLDLKLADLGKPGDTTPKLGDVTKPLTPTSIKLLEIVGADDAGELWIKVSIKTADLQDPQEVWIRAAQTNYEQVIRDMATSLGIQ